MCDLEKTKVESLRFSPFYFVFLTTDVSSLTVQSYSYRSSADGFCSKSAHPVLFSLRICLKHNSHRVSSVFALIFLILNEAAPFPFAPQKARLCRQKRLGELRPRHRKNIRGTAAGFSAKVNIPIVRLRWASCSRLHSECEPVIFCVELKFVRF